MPAIYSHSEDTYFQYPPQSSKRRKDITVYLTGFGGFQRISDNPSSQITSSFLPAGSTTHDFSAPGGIKYTIHFRPHPEPLRVAYKAVDIVVPEIWSRGDWDYILHLGVGMEGGYEVETIAHEGGYVKEDIDGLPGSGEEKRCAVKFDGVHGGEVKAKGTGHVYATGLDVSYIVESVQSIPLMDGNAVMIKKSTDAGMYLCEYIFRASLMEAAKRGIDTCKRVLFVHIPPKEKPYTVETGIEVIKRIVEAMILDGEGVRESATP